MSENQCDGCGRGLPVDDMRIHRNSDGTPFMVCSSEKYEKEPLLACPFCGTHNPIVMESDGKWWIQCVGCRSASDGYMDEHQAAFAWNRRSYKK